MFSLLTQASNAVQFALDSVVAAAEGATLAGYYLSTILLSGLTLCLSWTSKIGQALWIISEDFHHFLVESHDWLTESLVLFTESFVGCLIEMGRLPVQLAYFVGSGVGFLTNAMPNIVVQAVGLLIDSVILIGFCVHGAFSLGLSALMYLNEMPLVVLLLLAKPLDLWIAGSPDWANSRLVRAALGLIFMFFLVRIVVRFQFHRKFVRLSRKFSRIVLRAVTRGVIMTVGAVCRLVAVVVEFGAGKWKSMSISPSALPASTPSELREKLCVVCIDRPRDVVFMDCRHMCVCGPCASVVWTSGACPVCRAPILRIIKVYV